MNEKCKYAQKIDEVQFSESSVVFFSFFFFFVKKMLTTFVLKLVYLG